MLTTLLNWVGSFWDSILSLLFSILPNNNLLEDKFHLDVSQIDTTMAGVAQTVAQFNQIFPFDTLFFLFSMFLMAELILFFLRLFIKLVLFIATII